MVVIHLSEPKDLLVLAGTTFNLIHSQMSFSLIGLLIYVLVFMSVMEEDCRFGSLFLCGNCFCLCQMLFIFYQFNFIRFQFFLKNLYYVA